MVQTPPLSLLRIFEAAARTGSFRAASVSLNLTPSAVSHGIRKLELMLGIALFERGARQVRLTYEGEVLMRHLARGFDEIRRGLEAVSARAPKLLRLHCAPSFAAQWLTPRLKDFLDRHPGIEMRLAAGVDYTRFASDDFDADIVYGPPRSAGLAAVPLGEETVTPLCAPSLAARLQAPGDLLKLTLIQSDSKQVQWADWFAANHLADSPRIGARFDRSFLAIAAAAEGMGIALESTLLAERELAQGRLVAPLAECSVSITYVGHTLVYPRHVAPRHPLKAFADWLCEALAVQRAS